MTATRRLPDTYDMEVISGTRPKSKSVVNPEQFHFLEDVEEIRASGDSQTRRSRRLGENTQSIEDLIRTAVASRW